MESTQGLQLTSLTRTSLCPLAACWLSLSWLCSFTTSCVALRRWSSTTSSSASNRFTLCSNSRDRSRGIPPLESVNDWILLLSSRFSSWSLATWEKKTTTRNKRKKDQKLKHTIVPRLRHRHKKDWIIIRYIETNFKSFKFNKMKSNAWYFYRVLSVPVIFEIYSLGLPWEIVFGVITENKLHL